MNGRRFGLRFAGAALATFLASCNAQATEKQLLLELILNGHPTGKVSEFFDRDGVLFARPSDLHDLGFVVQLTAENEPIALASLFEVRAAVNAVKQTLVVTAPDAAISPTQLRGASAKDLVRITPPGFGALINYDILGTFTGAQAIGGALLNARVFGPLGLLEGNVLANTSPFAGQQNFARLDTTYTYTDADEMRRWRAGDVVTGALLWSRAVRLGGFQVASDFSLRPDLITYPLPVISASAAVPSTVNVLVNGVAQYSEAVQQGPFAVQTMPIVTGAGEVAVAVTDALGRQTFVTLPFYSTVALLKPGLLSYSAEFGSVRQNYGLATDRYTGWAADGSLRYGLSDWLTVEGHGEATGGLFLLGSGVTAQIGTFGVMTAALSGSSGYGGLLPERNGSQSGGLVSIGFQRISRSLSVSLQGSLASSGYRDLAAVNGTFEPRSTLTASMGYQFDNWGSIGIAYVRQRTNRLQGDIGTGPDHALIGNPQADLATASYTVPLGGKVTFYSTGYEDLLNKSYGLGFGFSFLFGDNTSASVTATHDNGQTSATAEISKSAVSRGDYGYEVQDTEGEAASRTAEGEYLSRWGRVTAGVSQTPDTVAGRVGATGAIAWAGGGLFASDRIDDSFAIVRTGDVANVPVLYENRLIGRTDSNGELLVPSLLSYQNNKLSLDVTRLPADVEVGQTIRLIRPPDRSGVNVDFDVHTVDAGLVKLHGKDGQPLPIGSIAMLPDAPDKPVGYDGEAYVTGLKPHNAMKIKLPDGSQCGVEFDYRPVKGDIPIIGPLLCQ